MFIYGMTDKWKNVLNDNFVPELPHRGLEKKWVKNGFTKNKYNDS